MNLLGAIERVEQVVDTAGSPDAGPADLKAALKASMQVQSFIAARRAELITALDEHATAFPESAIADTSGVSLNAASKEKQRADTLDAAAAMADALSDGDITPDHVDALTRAARNLDDTATNALLNDTSLAAAAAGQSVADFDALVKRKAKALDTSDDEARLERQRRHNRLRTWTDADGLYNVKGQFDPEIGKDIARRIAAATKAKFAETTPDNAPSDPFERTQFLEALALAGLITGESSGSGSDSGPPLVVVDATQGNGAGGPVVDWGIPVELPDSVLRNVLDASDPDVVIVANGVVLHAPGRLDLDRCDRLANRDQRRALQGLYSTCAIPGCAVHYDRCKLHHIIWWRDGGKTNLDNLLPVCQHHHTRIHNDNWNITLGTNRELTVTLPDGQVMRTGPPRRRAA